MKAKDIVAQEVARQAEFGYEPSWEDFVIAGRQAGIKKVVEYTKREFGVDWSEEKEQLEIWGIK